MSKYGTIIDLDFNPNHIEFKKIMVNYFNNPIMTKVRDNFNNKSVYMVYFKTLLAKDKRYLIVNTEVNTDEIGSKKKLSELDFSILQTKELDGIMEVPINQHTYSIRDNSKMDEYQNIISVTNRNKKFTEYKCPIYDIKITMIHKDNSLYEYPDSATLLSAIEKYSTLIFIE